MDLNVIEEQLVKEGFELENKNEMVLLMKSGAITVSIAPYKNKVFYTIKVIDPLRSKEYTSSVYTKSEYEVVQEIVSKVKKLLDLESDKISKRLSKLIDVLQKNEKLRILTESFRDIEVGVKGSGRVISVSFTPFGGIKIAEDKGKIILDSNTSPEEIALIIEKIVEDPSLLT